MLKDVIFQDSPVGFWELKTSVLPSGSNATGGTVEQSYGAVYGMEKSGYINSGTVSYPMPSNFAVNDESSYSLECVVKVDTDETSNILSPYLVVNAGTVEFHNGDNVLRYPVEDNEWHHIIAIHDSEEDQLYVNGAQVDVAVVEYESMTRPSTLAMTVTAFQTVALYSLPINQDSIEDHFDECFEIPDTNYDIWNGEFLDIEKMGFTEPYAIIDEEWLEGEFNSTAISLDGYLVPMFDGEDKSVAGSWLGVIPINGDDVVGDETLTNRIKNGSFNNGSTSGWSGVNCSISVVQNVDDDYMAALTPNGGSEDSYIKPTGLSFTAGTYTISAIASVEDLLTAETFHEDARSLVVYVDDQKYKAGRVGDEDDVEEFEITFEVPSDSSVVDIRLYNGSSSFSDIVYWDSVMLVEGEEIIDYLDSSMFDIDINTSSISFDMKPRDVYLEWEGCGDLAVSISQDEETWTPIGRRHTIHDAIGDDYSIKVDFTGGTLDDISEIRGIAANITPERSPQLFTSRTVDLIGKPYFSRTIRSPKQCPQEGMYFTNTDYIKINKNSVDLEDTVKMIELWIESDATGTIASTTGFALNRTSGTFVATGGTIVSNLNLTGKYTILVCVLDTAVNEDIIVKNGHITRLVLFKDGSTSAAQDVLSSYLKPTVFSSDSNLTINSVAVTENTNAWAIKSGG